MVENESKKLVYEKVIYRPIIIIHKSKNIKLKVPHKISSISIDISFALFTLTFNYVKNNLLTVVTLQFLKQRAFLNNSSKKINSIELFFSSY